MSEDISSVDLTLLGGFRLIHGGVQSRLGTGAEQLLALLALARRPQTRSTLARRLWPERLMSRAAGNLRSVIWRMPTGLVVASREYLILNSGVQCDVTEFVARARRLVDGNPDEALGDLDRLNYAADLLPGWDDDWVLMERERLRQLRVHALDALSACLTSAGRFSDGVAAGLASIEAEPLRETAHRSVIAAHIAEGNYTEAIRKYDTFRELLARELGLEPSRQLSELIRSATTHATMA